MGCKYIWVIYNIGTGRTFFYDHRPSKKELKNLCVLNDIYIAKNEDIYDVLLVEKRMIQ